MSKYSDPSSLTDALVEAAVGLLLVVVALGIAVWILSRIWLWVLGGALLVAGLLVLVRWLRSRDGGW